MSFCQRSTGVTTLAMFKPVVLPQASGNTVWASGLVVINYRRKPLKNLAFLTAFSLPFFSFSVCDDHYPLSPYAVTNVTYVTTTIRPEPPTPDIYPDDFPDWWDPDDDKEVFQ